MACDSFVTSTADGKEARCATEKNISDPPPPPPPAAAIEVIEVGQNGSGSNSPTADESRVEDHQEVRINGTASTSSSERLDHLDLQQSGHVQQQQHDHRFHAGRIWHGNPNPSIITNRRSQSVKEGSMGRSRSLAERLSSTIFWARTRSDLSRVADMSDWLAAQAYDQQQLDQGQNRVKDALNHIIFQASSKPTVNSKILALDEKIGNLPDSSRIRSGGSLKVGRGPGGGEDGGSAGAGGEGGDMGAVPEQSPIEEVALIVPTTDDPSLPVWTFRSWTLGIMSCCLLSFINTYFSYRREPIVLGVTTALIVSSPLGQFMAAVLPNKFVRVPGTRYGFSLNPGEFNTKEHSLVVQFASAGALRPGGLFVVTLVKIYLKGTIDFFPSYVFTLTCELMALCWGGMLQKFLIEPASMWWPASLVNVSLVNLFSELFFAVGPALHALDQCQPPPRPGTLLLPKHRCVIFNMIHAVICVLACSIHCRALHTEDKRKGMSRIQFFLVCLIASFAYHVLPGYLFPTLSGISLMCYVFKHSTLAQQLGSGNRGLGLGAFSLDYATIASFLGSPLVVPSIAVFNIIVGFAFQAYVLVPITYWRNYYKAQNFPLFSSALYTWAGHSYNVSRILTTSRGHGNFQFDRAGYDVEGPTYFSAFYAVSTGLTFMLFGCIIAQVLLFHGGDLWRTVKSVVTMKQEAADVHTHLMRKYPQVPAKWYITLLLALHVASCVTVQVYKEQLQMKWWGVMLGDAVIAILVLPICILVATTNQLPNLAIMAQYMMGYIRPGEPVTSAVFRTYSTVVCGRVAIYLNNFKFGHYMKLPPRASFLSQAIGTVVATLVGLGVTWWLTSTIDNICDTTHLPRNTPWTCPGDRVFFDQAVTWGLVGPKKLFDKGGPYNSLNYYFLPGMLLPIILWLLQRAFPHAVWLTYINAPLIVRGAWAMPPSAVVNNTTWLAIALVFSVYVFTYKKRWWQRYNYMLSAALDTGTVMMAVLLYYTMDEGKKRLHWWGRRDNGDHCPLATCPIAVPKPGCHGY